MKAERLALAALGVVAASPMASRLADHMATAPSLCPSQIVFGVACPSCGGTRAGLHLLAGEPLEALSVNPGVTVLAVALGVMILAGRLRWNDVAEWLGVAKPEPPVADLRR